MKQVYSTMKNSVLCLLISTLFGMQAFQANALSISALSSASYVAGAQLNVNYTGSGFVAGNVFTAQLSDATGNFASPTSIGTLTSTGNSGTINATIPLA